MLTIYLARHGQDEDNANGILNGRRDTSLTKIGVKQAHALAEMLKETNITFDAVYSSPLKRAYTTAEIVTDTLNLPKPEKLDLLLEREFGVMTGEYIKDIEKLCSPEIFKTDKATYFIKAKGAESFPEMITRARLLISQIKEKHDEGNVLLVCHGDIGKMIFAAYYNLSWQDALSMFHLGNSEVLILSPEKTPETSRLYTTKQYNV